VARHRQSAKTRGRYLIQFNGQIFRCRPFSNVVTLYSHGEQPDALLKRADEALSHAKLRGAPNPWWPWRPTDANTAHPPGTPVKRNCACSPTSRSSRPVLSQTQLPAERRYSVTPALDTTTRKGATMKSLWNDEEASLTRAS